MAAEPLPEHSAEALYEDAPCGYLSMLADGTIVKANRTFLRSTGHSAEQVVGRRRLQDLLAPGSRIFHDTHWRPMLGLQGEVREIPADLVRADGSRLPVLVNAVLSTRPSGEPAAIRASLFDATDRRRYERELRERYEQQAAVVRLGARALEGAAIPVLLEGARETVSEMLRADHAEIVEGDPGPSAGGPIGADGTGDTLRVAIGPAAGGFGTLVVHSRTPKRFTPADRDFAEAVAIVLWNAVERRRSEDARRHQATHDPLTGLPNRLLLDERLSHEVARARRDGSLFGLCLLDLDHFKLINDSFGHVAGDTLLCAVGDRLRAAVRGLDMVVRLGGDEFVVLCADVDRATGAAALPGRIATALREPFTICGAEHVVRASVGVVLGGPDSSPESLLRDADVAMYRAKERGRAQHAHFDESMREGARERLRTEAELRIALRRGDLRVFYQPVVAAADGRVCGLEALVRWEHPERGLVPPGAFIPVAEDSGLILDVGRFVLQEACSQLVAWRRDGVVPDGVGVAVNVSGRQLGQPQLAAEVADLLTATGLEPHLLGLEITETVLMQSSRSPAAVLAELDALGVRLLLDDFGTGASSLARLRRFPVDTLKIDRAFITGLGRGDGDGEDEDEAIVAAVVAMADALGLRVVAEGVETEGQLDILRRLGCRLIQGYLFARPLPAGELRALLLDAVDGRILPAAR